MLRALITVCATDRRRRRRPSSSNEYPVLPPEPFLVHDSDAEEVARKLQRHQPRKQPAIFGIRPLHQPYMLILPHQKFGTLTERQVMVTFPMQSVI
jgi:hypothetical protein